jgi:hypothetical protein
MFDTVISFYASLASAQPLAVYQSIFHIATFDIVVALARSRRIARGADEIVDSYSFVW